MSTQNQNQRLDIYAGPSKYDLMICLFEKDRLAEFTVGTNGSTLVGITSVGKEDGSGESWIIDGYLLPSYAKIHASFSTKTRKGWMQRVGR